MIVSKDLSLTEQNGMLYLFSFSRGASVPIDAEDIPALVSALQESRPTPDAADGAKAGNLKYWQHDETGRQCAKAQRPSPRWFEITQGQYDGSDDDYPAKPPRR